MLLTCNYPDCGREEVGNSRCLLHLDNKNANQSSEFAAWIQRYINSSEARPETSELSFKGFRFPAGFELPMGAVIHKKLNFSDTIFYGYIRFTGMTFADDVTFEDAFFGKGAEFDNAKFAGALCFDRANSNGDISFKQADFGKNASFRSVRMSSSIQEGGLKNASIFFNEAIFRRTISMNNADVSGSVVFVSVKFLSESSFQACNFRVAHFDYCSFEEASSFEGTTFTSAVFDGARFVKRASFYSARFIGVVSFAYAVFADFVTFLWATFGDQVHFDETSFDEGMFYQTRFQSLAYFKAPQKRTKQSVLLFYLASFDRPKLVTFIGWSFSNLSFLRTDVSDMLIVPGASSVGNLGILDEELMALNRRRDSESLHVTEKQERILDLLGPYLTIETVIAEYKNLRKCLENNRMFTEAADLFVREMGLSLKRIPHNSPFEWLAHWLYGKISRYGESVNRPVVFSLIIIAITSLMLNLLYARSTLTFKTYIEFLTVTSSIFIQIRSLRDFPTMQNVPVWVEIFLRVSSIILIGSLFVAIKRRLERK